MLLLLLVSRTSYLRYPHGVPWRYNEPPTYANSRVTYDGLGDDTKGYGQRPPNADVRDEKPTVEVRR